MIWKPEPWGSFHGFMNATIRRRRYGFMAMATAHSGSAAPAMRPMCMTRAPPR